MRCSIDHQSIIKTLKNHIVFDFDSNCWRQHQAKKAKDSLENSYQAYSLGIHEGSLKLNQSGRRISKSGVVSTKLSK